MTKPFPVSDKELLERTAELAAIERACAADVVEHVAEIDRRRAYLDAACRSLSCYCIERLGYSDDQARLRVQVARLALRFPQVLEELRAGRHHMTGLSMLAPVLTEANVEELLPAARGKSKGKLEELIARYFPKPDVPERVCPQPEQLPAPALSGATRGTSGSPPAPPAKVAPLSESRWSVQLTIGAELKAKIEEARKLLSHAVPNGELATLVERAFDALLEQEKKRRFGADKPRKQRALKPGSRHIPVELARIAGRLAVHLRGRSRQPLQRARGTDDRASRGLRTGRRGDVGEPVFAVRRPQSAHRAQGLWGGARRAQDRRVRV